MQHEATQTESDASLTGRGGDRGGPSKAGNQEDQGRDVVEVSINNTAYPIHRGRQTVIAIKQAGGVPLAHELAQVIEGNTPPLTPLADDGAVTIKGGEQFVSYPKDSASS